MYIKRLAILMKYMHFNEKFPQFQNIYSSNTKEKYVRVYDGKKWIIEDRNKILEDLIIQKIDLK